MKRIALIFALAAVTTAAQLSAQTPAPTTTPKSATPKSATAKPATAAKPGATAARSAGTAGPKLPPGVPPVKGIVKPAFTLRYQDFKIGTGALAEPMKLYKVKYTGWLASDGTKFDSSDDHVRPLTDKDGKPVMGDDGKPKMGEPEPIQFPQGRGRVIPGWDQGFEGMHIGGKRRLFIPYQLAYGAAGRPPKIPAKSDLIFDVELVDIADMPPMAGPGGRPLPQRPGMPGAPGGMTRPPAPTAPGGTASPANPSTSAPAPPSGKPADPTAPTVSPNSSVPPPVPNAQPTPTAPPAGDKLADKPANPAQPN